MDAPPSLLDHSTGPGSHPLEDGGVAFEVWAPHARSVSVIGTFTPEFGVPLEPNGNGFWRGVIAEARVGDEYRYRIVGPAGTFDRIDPHAVSVTNSVGNAVVYDHNAFQWTDHEWVTPAHHELVIYELHAGTFAADGDTVGSIDGVTERLPMLRDLGVNAIELMPIAEFAGDRSWGYNPAHPFAVEAAYGGPDALKRLVDKAHSLGIAVICDVVYNHFGPSDLDLWQFDGWSENEKGGVYFYNDDRASTPWGDTRPDYGREEVRSYLIENALSWLRAFHADGLRLDMTQFIRTIDGATDLPEGWTLLRAITDACRAEFPSAILIAEDLQGDDSLTETAAHGAGFHAQWDAGFVHPVRRILTAALDEHRSLDELEAAMLGSGVSLSRRVLYTESHDEVANGSARIPHEINAEHTDWYARSRALLGMAILSASPGIPMLFQGQEHLESGWFSDEHPIDWSLDERNADARLLVQDLLRLRRNLDGRTRGLSGDGFAVLAKVDGVLAVHRWSTGGAGDDVVVLLHLGGSETTVTLAFPHEGLWHLECNTSAGVYGSQGPPAGDLVSSGPTSIALAPYSAHFYSFAG